MDVVQAANAIESLRDGVPPEGLVRQFTVGRKREIRRLNEFLSKPDGTALLLKANYGAGKSHLIKYLREEALAQNFAVSTVIVNSKEAVRFNRMDQILGAVFSGLEIPQVPGFRGPRPFFGLMASAAAESRSSDDGSWSRLSRSSRWDMDYAGVLESPAMYVALRSWIAGDGSTVDLIESWLTRPWEYRTQRKLLYESLVLSHWRRFRDPRSPGQFYADGVFEFHTHGHAQSWAVLRDIDRLAKQAALRGMIILFDEFEDVISLSRRDYREDALRNLFTFYAGKQYPGKTFFAVTPLFAMKCEISTWRTWGFDQDLLRKLPTFQMSPLGVRQIEELADRIIKAHAAAYEWNAARWVDRRRLREVIHGTAQSGGADRTREAVKQIVRVLDDALQSSP